MLEKPTDNRKAWTQAEDQAILDIVKELGVKNWPLVSQLMKEKYQLVNRTGKQCRQRWHNQLNPELIKKPWDQQEQQQLFEAHRKYGNRWIEISKLFPGRTDNSIKNHFYSTIRRSMRRICKLLGNRNSTSKLRNIRPSILSQIFQFSKTQHMKSVLGSENMDVATCLLYYAQQKPNKGVDFDSASKKDMESLVKKLIFLNQEYVNFKNQKKKNSLTNRNAKRPKKQLCEKTTILAESDSQFHEFSRSNISRESEVFGQVKAEDLVSQTRSPDIFVFEQDLEEQMIEEQIMSDLLIHGQDIESQCLIVKKMPIHANFESIFDQTDKFHQKQKDLFHHLEKPSFHDIQYCQYEIEGGEAA